MSKVLIIVLCFSLYNCLSQAQILSDQWVISEPNGCKLIDPYFQNGMSFTWDGPCKDSMAQGFGKLIKYNNGEYESTFEGNYNMGVREGVGTFSHKDGTSRSGNFVKGQLMGYGTMKDNKGTFYSGNFINYRIHGIGNCVWPDKSQFEGYFVSDNPYTGKFITPAGTITYIQQFYKVDTIIENKSIYNPKIGREIIEYFDSDWERCTKDSASYYREITYLKDNEPKGIIKDYYISGILQSEYQCIYVDYDDEGKNFKEGKKISYYESGNVERLIFYYNNKINGSYTNFYENGKIYDETQYAHGVQNGEYKQYYPTGKIELSGYIVNDERTSHWINYDEEGNVTDTIDLSQNWDDLNQEFEDYLKDENYEKAMEIAEISNKFALLKYGGNHENFFTSLNNIGFIYLRLEQYQNAFNFFGDALDYTKKTVGKTHHIYATFLNSIGWLHSQKGEYEKTLPYYIEALENTEFNFGKTHPKYGTRLSNVALLYLDMGHYEKAVPYAIEALKVTEKNFGILNPEYGSRVRDLGFIYLKMDQEENALPYYLKALEYHENIRDIDSEKYGDLLDILNIIYKKLGQSENLINILSKKIEFTIKKDGKATTEYLKILINIGELYSDLGQYEKALPFLLEALKNTEENLGYDHPSLGSVLHNLGFCFSNVGQYDQAIFYLSKSLKYTEKNVGKTHPDYITSLISISSLYNSAGQYTKALNHSLETQKHIEKSVGKEHFLYGLILNNIGIIYFNMGQYNKALDSYLACLENTEKSLGKTHSSYNKYLNNIGVLLTDVGKYEIALEFLLEALKLAEDVFGKEHPSYVNKLNSISYLYSYLGQYHKALSYALEAQQIVKNNSSKSSIEYGTIINNIGSIYSSLGQYEKVLPLYLETLENTEKNFGKAHPEYAKTLNNIGFYYYKLHQFEIADSFINYGCQILLDHFKLNSKFLSEKDIEIFYNMIGYNFIFYKGLFLKDNTKRNSTISRIYNLELKLKSLILRNSTDMRKTLLLNSDNFTLNRYDEWFKLRSIIAKENILPLAKRRRDLSSIQEYSNIIETELARISAPFRNDLMLSEWTNILQSLDSNTVSIEFVELPIFEDNNSFNDEMVAAILLNKSDAYPKFIPLFQKSKLDSLIERSVAKESSFINKLYSDPKMFELIWKPLEPFIKKGNQIYFAPSGILNQINLGAIQMSDSTYLSDEYTFHQVTTTAILALGQDEEMAVQDIAIFGGIDFDASDEQIASAAKDVMLSDDIVSRSLYTQDSTRSGKWTYLNGTLDEAQNIDNMAKSKKIQSQLFTGSQAIEERFKSLSGEKSPSVIHIATHGFFFPDPKVDKKKLEMMSFQSYNTFTLADNPMNRSGLLFAGGNKAWIGEELTTAREDGILTAYEVSNMLLFNTELVVLSACETGLGDIKGSEGVYGLQRAFKQAGVRYLMMSLWKVPDNATKEFMTTFYTKYLTNQKPVREAFNITQTKMKDKYRNEPYKWGGFVLME